MERNNFDIILPTLEFANKNTFYFIQIIQRKKDDNEVHVSSGYRRLKSFYIYSKEDLLELKDRIINLCQSNNARAYISVVPKNAKEVALTCIQKYSELILNDNAFMGNNIWDSCCGSTKAKGYPNVYVVDVDTQDIEILERIKTVLLTTQGSPFIKTIVPTINGYHIICGGFNTKQFKERAINELSLNLDIQKNNLTLLYYKKTN